MSTYSLKFGEGIGDAVINGTGDLANWESCLSANFFNSWTPSLYAGQVIQTAGTFNQTNITQFAEYPANNASVPDIDVQINEVFTLMNAQNNSLPYNIPFILGGGQVPVIEVDATLPEVDTNTYFEVSPLSTIGDVVLNSTGDITNWSDILNQNGFNTWTPLLYAGQKVAIPASVNMNLNNYRGLNTYPANNNSVPDIYEQINIIFDTMNLDVWILAEGIWNGKGIWTADGLWNTI